MWFFLVVVVLDANPCLNSNGQGESEKLMRAPLKLSRRKLAECVGGLGHLATKKIQ